MLSRRLFLAIISGLVPYWRKLVTIVLCDDEAPILRILTRLLARSERVERVVGCQGPDEVHAALTKYPHAHLVTDYHLSSSYTGCDLIRQVVDAGYRYDRAVVVSGGIIDSPLACAGRTIRLWTKPLKLSDCAELVNWLAAD